MKSISIEDLLKWAFTFELGKVDAGGSGSFSAAWRFTERMAELGTMIDRTPNSYGVIPGFVEDGDPHPDALLVGDAVRGLEGFEFDMPEDWQPFADLDDEYGLIELEVESVVSELRLTPEMMRGRRAIGIIISAALLGKGPEWRVARPEYSIVSSNGQPKWFVRKRARDSFGRTYWCEVDGFDRRKRRPAKGAYRKFELIHSMRTDVLSRLEWQMWQTALDALADDLRPRLAAHRIQPFHADLEPWSKMHTSANMAQPFEISI
ncbi:hypothetical protein [Rhizobium sp. FKY42]|uniref:hypothetical protein n=1 Tax=Rhizobium sp. FKY42 TaxID=2562310 RepID=UPI0010C0D6D1|nr:hypothetical protein [Rhizobium sp. FKY42]